MLVAGATLAGGRLLATSDDTVTVWATTEPVRAGQDVSAAELAPSRVQLDDAAAESAYLPAESTPTGVFGQDLAAGELVPVGAVTADAAVGRVDLSLAVGPGDAPVDLAEGDLVDVYAVPDPTLGGAETTGRADLMLQQVRVLTVRSGAALGDASQQVVLGLDDSRRLGAVLGTLATALPVLVRVAS